MMSTLNNCVVENFDLSIPGIDDIQPVIELRKIFNTNNSHEDTYNTAYDFIHFIYTSPERIRNIE